jgi:hypothetical protein
MANNGALSLYHANKRKKSGVAFATPLSYTKSKLDVSKTT